MGGGRLDGKMMGGPWVLSSVPFFLSYSCIFQINPLRSPVGPAGTSQQQQRLACRCPAVLLCKGTRVCSTREGGEEVDRGCHMHVVACSQSWPGEHRTGSS